MKTAAWIKKILFVALLVVTGCQSLPLKTEPALEDEGEVFLYVQPFEKPDERLKFSFEGISAVRDDGVAFPLALLVSDFNKNDMARQRLIAQGRLPVGSYQGFFFQTKKASLETANGEAALLVPEAPSKREFMFKVERKKAYVLSLKLKFSESIPDGYHFSPAFFIYTPPTPVPGVTGYVTNVGLNTITVFDKVKMEAIGVIATGAGPRGMVVDQTHQMAYAALSDEDAIEVIDVADGTVLDRIVLIRGDEPQELVLTPDGRTLLAVDSGSNMVSIIDTGLRMEVTRIPVGNRPCSILIEKTGRKAYVFNNHSDNISVIDIAGRAVMGTIATGPEPLRGQFNRNGDRLYVIHASYPYLYTINPESFSLVRRDFIGLGVSSIKVDTRTDRIYVGKKYDSVVTVYDPLAVTPVEYIPTKGWVNFMTIDNDNDNLYMLIPDRKVLTVVNLISGKSISDIDVSGSPSWVAMMGER